MRHIIIGDVHGMLAELKALLAKVRFQKPDQIVFVGDLVDKGPESCEVVAYARKIGAILVEGNHESKHRQYRRYIKRAKGKSGMKNSSELREITACLSKADVAYLDAAIPFYRIPGHNATVVHGGVLPETKTLDPEDKATMSRIMRVRYVSGVSRSKMTIRLIVNGLGEKDSPPFTELARLADSYEVTKREFRPKGSFLALGKEGPGDPFWADVYGVEDAPRFGHIYFGHTPWPDGPKHFPHATGIDTGCVYGGSLTAAILGDGPPHFVSVGAGSMDAGSMDAGSVDDRSVDVGSGRTLLSFLADVAKAHGIAENTYVVGGAVRDQLLGRPWKDVDIVVDTVSQPQSERFAEYVAASLPVDAEISQTDFGVRIVRPRAAWEFGEAGEAIEIANARTETYSPDDYRPIRVRRATVYEDVSRRDFTINALYRRLSDLSLLDGLSGVDDLRARRIASVGDPERSFRDDPTRMLRAVKFQARLGFSLEGRTRDAILKLAAEIQRVPWERLSGEVVSMLMAPSGLVAARSLRDLGLLGALSAMPQGLHSYLSRQLVAAPVEISLILAAQGLRIAFLSFLGYNQLRRVQVAIAGMSNMASRGLLKRLKHPPIDNKRISALLGLQGRDKGLPSARAREILIKDPSLDADQLNRAVLRSLS